MATVRLAAAVCLLLTSAAAHDMPRGCYAMTNVDVHRVPHGYLIIGLDRFIHDDDAIPSGDDLFWVCTAGNDDYALFVPPRILDGEEP